MKRLVGVLFTIVILYSIYFDLSHGTLPTVSNEQSTMVTKESEPEEQTIYFEKTVKPGDTVLSIIESQLNKSIPVPISEVIADFKELNNGIAPQEIQAGKEYKFPNYMEEQ